MSRFVSDGISAMAVKESSFKVGKLCATTWILAQLFGESSTSRL